MSRLQTLAAGLAAALLSSACYRVTVVTTAAPVPAGAPTVDRQWNHSFINGLVPPPPVDVSQPCRGGNVQQVVTQRSFLNGLVGGLTFGIYTPLQISVACPGARTSSADAPAGAAVAAVATVAGADSATQRADAPAPARGTARP